MTAFDKAWNVVKGLEPVEERTEDKLDQVLNEVRNRPPKEGIELPGMVRSGSEDDEGSLSVGYTSPHYQGSHNEYIPMDENAEPLSMEPMSWASARDVLDAYEEKTGKPCNSLTQIRPVEGGLADRISDQLDHEATHDSRDNL